MGDNKKYYYLKIKEDFFDSNEMIILENMPDGYKYSNILLKMYLRSLKGDGLLMVNDTIPFNAQMLAAVTRHSAGDIERAIRIFKELGLVDVFENGAINMNYIQKYIGRSSTEAERMKESRLRRKLAAEKTKGIETQSEDKGTDLEKTVDAQKEPESEADQTKYTLGKENLSCEAYARLIGKYSRKIVDSMIEKIMTHPYLNCLNEETISEWCACSRKWQEKMQKKKGGFFDFEQREYDYDELEKKLLNSQDL